MTTEKVTVPSTNGNAIDENDQVRILIFIGANKVIRKLITEHGEIFPNKENICVKTLTKIPKKRITRFNGKTIFIMDLSYDVVIGDKLKEKQPFGNCEIEHLRYPIGRQINPSKIKQALLTTLSKHISCS